MVILFPQLLEISYSNKSDDTLLPRSVSSSTSSLSSTRWMNTTSTILGSSSQTISTPSIITKAPDITALTPTLSTRRSSSTESCIVSNPTVSYVTSTITTKGSTISVASNATATTTDEYFSTPFCQYPVPFSPPIYSPPALSRTEAPSSLYKQGQTMSIMITKKTSVLVQQTANPIPGLNYDPQHQTSYGPNPPAETGDPRGSGNRGTGSQGGSPGSQGGGSSNQGGGNPGSQGQLGNQGVNSNTDKLPTMVIPGMGGIISSLFAAHPTWINPSGAIVSPSPAGGSSAAPTNSGDQENTAPGAGSNSGTGDISGSRGGSAGAIVNNIPVVVGPSNVVVGGATFTGASPTQITIAGETFSLLPSHGGIIIPGGMTVAAPSSMITPPPSSMRVGGYPLNFDPAVSGQIEVAGSTYQLPSQGSSVVVAGGATLTLKPNQVIDSTTTAYLPSATSPEMPQFTALTVDGVSFNVGSSMAVIDGHTLEIGEAAPTSTLVIGTETIIAGPNGLSFPHTTIAPLGSSLTPVTADVMVFSMGPDDVVISGTTYFFSKPTAVTVGSETISIGPSGVGLATTIIAASTSTTISTKEAPTSGQSPLNFETRMIVVAVAISLVAGLLA